MEWIADFSALLNFKTKKMKNIILPFFCGIICLSTMTACNESSKKQSETTTIDSAGTTAQIQEPVVDCSGMPNFYIDSVEGRQMIDSFANIYRKENTPKPVNALSKEVWIEACVINAYSKFLDSATDFDGVRIYMGANLVPGAEFPGQAKKHKAFFIMVPTKPSATNHEDIWGDVLKKVCNSSYKHFNLPQGVANLLIKKYGKEYREESNPGDRNTAKIKSLSVSVWLSKCVFKEMARVLSIGTNQLDGVRLYAGAYDKMDNAKHPGQLYQFQSTILLVPTSKHKDNWTILKRDKSNEKFYAYNHGTLCPDICP